MKQILEISADEYFSLPYLSQSAIKDFRNEGSWTYYHKYVKGDIQSKPPSDAMKIGSALHAIICPDIDIAETISVVPEWIDFGGMQPEKINRRLKKHREYLADFEAKNKGKITLTAKDMDTVMGMRESVLNNPAISKYINRLTAKRSEVVALNKVNEYDCKAMCDADFSDEGLIIDFKTTRQHLGKEFVKDAIWKYGYQYQAAHYCDVFNAERFLIVAIRNFPPYESMVFEMPEEFIGQARMLNYQVIDRIKYCESLSEWHSDGWGEIINIEEIIDA